MERFKILIIAAGLLLTSCSTSNNVVKDVIVLRLQGKENSSSGHCAN